MTPQMKTLTITLAGIAAIAGGGAAVLWGPIGQPVVLATGNYLEPSRALPDFSLIDQHGRAFGSAQLRGHWSMLFFGYTNCPDFCPATLTTLAALEKRLRADGAAVRPQVVFMSVDARRDTPAQLANYVPYFDPEFIGITASTQPALDAVAKKLGVEAVITPHADGSYSVEHSGSIYVVNPDGKVAAVLLGPFTVDALQSDFKRIVAGHA